MMTMIAEATLFQKPLSWMMAMIAEATLFRTPLSWIMTTAVGSIFTSFHHTQTVVSKRGWDERQA